MLEIYAGNWSSFQADLTKRLFGKPYPGYKIAERIEEDLKNISRLEMQEILTGTNLSDFLKE